MNIEELFEDDGLRYDPHIPQNVPHTLRLNFSTEEGASGFYDPASIEAMTDEVVWSDDTCLRQHFLPEPPGVISLTEAAPREAGFKVEWSCNDREMAPVPGQVVKMTAPYD